MTFTNTEIAEVYAQEQTIEDKKLQPAKPAFERQASFWELLYIGGTEGDFAHSRAEYIPYGFQVKKVGQKKRVVPAWALDNRFFLHVFGEPAMKRARVAYLFWRVGLTPSQIAAETKFSETYIRNVINKLRGKTSPQGFIGAGLNGKGKRKPRVATGEPTRKPGYNVDPTQSPRTASTVAPARYRASAKRQEDVEA